MTTEETCACGRLLHYTSEEVRRVVEMLVLQQGPLARVSVPATPLPNTYRTWLVPRHYIALHGLKADELPALAERFGFREVP